MNRYLVWQSENGETVEDAVVVMAADEQSAAEQWADEDDFESNEYTIASGVPATIMIRDPMASEATEWIVSGELVRRYTARAKAPPDVAR